MTTVQARPAPNYQALRSRKVNAEVFYSDFLFFHLGREALVFGMKKLGIKQGSKILIPAYMCNTNIEPLRQHGYQLIFVDINLDLSNNLEIIKEAIEKYKVQAVLAVHYFGFPSNIEDLAKLCNLYQIKLIEDCAHSFLTKINGTSVGSFGHIGVFSMRKSLPVPDGGALKINDISSSSGEIRLRSFQSKRFKDLNYLILRLLENFIIKLGYPNIYSSKLTYAKNKIRVLFSNEVSEHNKADEIREVEPSFQLKTYLNNKDYLTEVINARRDNYQYLLEGLKKIGFNSQLVPLPSECAPQFLILNNEKKGLLQWLRDNGVGAINWPGPELPSEIKDRKKDFPITNRLNDNLVMLPIHQSVTKRNHEYIIGLIKKWHESI